MAQVKWRTGTRNQWAITEMACKFAYHYCLACGEDGVPEHWRQRVQNEVSEAVPEELAGYLFRFLVEGATLAELIRDGLPREKVYTIRKGRRRVFYRIATAYWDGSARVTDAAGGNIAGGGEI